MLSWDFINGCYTDEGVFCVTNHGEAVYDVLTLFFDEGTTLDIISDHGLFDRNEMKFVNLDATNYTEYIGHTFVIRDENGNNREVILTGGSIEERLTSAYSLISTHTLDVIANGLLTADPSIYFLFPFEINDDLRYDEEKMAQDIEAFGLLTYEEFHPFAPHMTETQFYAGNGHYINVALGKGIVTMEEIMMYAQRLLVDQEILIDSDGENAAAPASSVPLFVKPTEFTLMEQ